MLYVININRLRQQHSVLIMSKFISLAHLFIHAARHLLAGREHAATSDIASSSSSGNSSDAFYL